MDFLTLSFSGCTRIVSSTRGREHLSANSSQPGRKGRATGEGGNSGGSFDVWGGAGGSCPVRLGPGVYSGWLRSTNQSAASPPEIPSAFQARFVIKWGAYANKCEIFITLHTEARLLLRFSPDAWHSSPIGRSERQARASRNSRARGQSLWRSNLLLTNLSRSQHVYITRRPSCPPPPHHPLSFLLTHIAITFLLLCRYPPNHCF